MKSAPESRPLRWLFLDLNSYFASVEQQLDPRLRGRPVAVVPMVSDATCAIAASHEAKKYGVKTGTNIGEARRLCPGLVLVAADHSRYVEFHERIKEEVEKHYPIEEVASIDEVALLLDSKRQSEEVALDLARRLKKGLRENIGECITCSIGIAPSRYLAKVASDIQKPDGLVVLKLEDMPGRISHWKLTDLFGIGRRMEPRLRAAGILSVEDLWNAPSEVLHQVWGGVGGDRFWHELHGGDLGEFATQSRSVGHSHVLAPELRRPPEAAIVARRLLFKAASRLRRQGYRAGAISLSVSTEDRGRGDAGLRLPKPVSDTFTLMHLLLDLWPVVMGQVRWARVKKVAVTLHDIVPVSAPEQLELFPAPDPLGQCDGQERVERYDKLSDIMDRLNQRYGRDSIALGFVPDQVKGFSGTKIAFTRIPDMEEFKE